MVMNGKFLVVLGIVVIGIITGGYWYSVRQIQLYEFAGNIIQVGDNSIDIEGDTINPVDEQARALRMVEAFIGPKTKITRVALRLPSDEELKQLPGGMYRPENLSREESEVGLDKLRDDFKAGSVGVTAWSNSSIVGRNSFQAVEIIYTIGVLSAQ